MSSEYYYLMHKNDIVTSLIIDSITGNITKVSATGNFKLIPFGGRKSSDELKKWWARRAVPISQGNIKRLLQQEDIPTTQSLLVQNLGLSLTDHYWIKPVNSVLCWNDVNLYENDFKDTIENWKYVNSNIDLENATTFYPGSSLQGELEKKWIIEDNKRFLVKGNYNNSSQQSANEVIASLIHKKQNKFSFVDYKFCQISFDDENKIGCISKNFTDINTEFIPAYEIINSIKKNNQISDYEHFIDICCKNGLDKNYVRSFLEYEIITDFIMTNVDRHYNNFGVLRNSDTLEFIAMAPIFDSGNSLFWNNPQKPINNDLTNVEVSGFRKVEIDMLKYVKNFDVVNLDLLPKAMEIEEILHKVKMIDDDIKGIIVGYNKKIELLKNYAIKKN